MGTVKTNDQRLSKGIVANDRPTTVKGHSWKRSLNDCEISSIKQYFQDRKGD